MPRPRWLARARQPAARAEQRTGWLQLSSTHLHREHNAGPPHRFTPYNLKKLHSRGNMSSVQNQESFVRWLRQVTPYVHAFRGRTFVVGFGGEMFAERARFASFIHDLNLLAALGIRLVLVHGARPQIEAELKAKGTRSRYAQGLRVTDEAALMAGEQAGGGGGAGGGTRRFPG